MRPLTDNMQPTSLSELGYEQSVNDLLRISDININALKDNDGSSLLVFPNSFEQDEQNLGGQSIIHFHWTDKTISTGNIMGFVGVNDTMLSIRSRFSKEDSDDYFLHYLLMKVFSINLFNLKYKTTDESVFDFLPFLFPHFLKKALRQGLFKSYVRNEYNDANVKGSISVNRHLRLNIPFNGRISYSTREHSYDNDITQLIRHTIEHIKKLNVGILHGDSETFNYVMQICNATPSYCPNRRRNVILNNYRPVKHPYYTEYTALQKLCLQILRHDSIKYGDQKDKVYGILFDGAWLWEEYLNTILKKIGYNHAQNKKQLGGKKMFVSGLGNGYSDNGQVMYPDFYSESIVLDAKYKHLNGNIGRDDLYQVVSYMHCLDKKIGGYIYPNNANNNVVKYKLAGMGGVLFVIPFDVPQNADSWEEYIGFIEESENSFISKLPNVNLSIAN